MENLITFDLNDNDDVAEEFAHCFTGECRVNVLPTIYKISQVSMQSGDLTALLSIILEVMQQYLRMQRGMIMLYDRQAETIFIHDSFGLTDEEKWRGVYAPGEGVTGKVVQSGKHMVLLRIGKSADFLDRTQAHTNKLSSNASFICVPIMSSQRVIGTICAERIYRNQDLLRMDVKFLSTIASLIGPAAELFLVENLEKKRLENENRRLKLALKRRFKPSNIIGNSKPMTEVYALIEKVAASRATVLILGESGVGKELVANAIHYNSPYSSGPFIKANCAALPETLAESELFGHEKGSFTGATNLHRGYFEQANGGTIFLDEIGELNLSMQVKLLRFLQERTFERVGGRGSIKVDVRIIAATNRNLEDMVEQGTFREDLYYRLNVFPITIPSLRDRGSDIITLADHFATHYAKENGKKIERISTTAQNMLMSYHWPGNVRELENVIERSVILSEDGVIHSYDLPPSLQLQNLSEQDRALGLEAKIREIEREMIVEALRNSNGNVGDAARELSVTRRMLSFRMNKLGLDYKNFRAHGKP